MNETPQQYTERLLGLLKGKDPLEILASTPRRLARLLRGVPKKKLSKRPAPDRWSVTEILAHLADAEMVISFRLRLILGSNGVTIQAFDQDAWAGFSQYPKQDPAVSFEAFRVLRDRNAKLLKMIPREMWENYGMHTERGKETVTRVIQMTAGHDINHLGQIESILQSRKK